MKFQNPPLNSISFEIRFPSYIKISEQIPDFQSDVREELPYFFSQSTPKYSKHGVVEEMSWIFRSDSDDIILRIKNNLITLTIDKYVEFDIVQKYINKFFPQFLNKIEKLTNFTRIGLRYINSYNFGERKSNVEKFLAYFKLSHLVINTSDIIDSFNFFITKKMDDYHMNLKYKYGIPPNGEEYIFLFDYDCFASGSFKKDNFNKIVIDLKQLITKNFKENITEKFITDVLKVKE